MNKQLRERKRTGIYLVHMRGCLGGDCRCGDGKHGSYQATVFSKRDGKLIRKHFSKLREAELWRGELRGARSNAARCAHPRGGRLGRPANCCFEG
jgi:hypothetical protein